MGRRLTTSLAVLLLLGGASLCAQQTGGPHLDALPQTPQPQATASLSGDVSDSHDGLVPDATISAVRKGTGEILQATSDGAGHFNLTGLTAGTWTVTVSAIGLEKYQAEPIELKAGERAIVPGVVLPIAMQKADVTVTVTTKQVAEVEIHDEEKQRVLAIFPNFYTSYLWNAAPLTAGQKFQLGIRSVTDPVSFIAPAIVAGAEQANNTYPGFGNDAPSYFKRYAAAYGDALFGRILGSSVFPSLFRQDPRYFYLGPNYSKAQRTKHALLSGLIARGDNGKSQFNYSHVVGNASAGALSTAYHPRADVGPGQLAYTNALIGIGGEGVVALFREFLWPHLTHNMPPYRNGKPAPVAKPTPMAKPTKQPSSAQ